MGKLEKVKLGILGGGQLGKMLVQAGSRWNLEMYVLDPDIHCPASTVCPRFTCGSFRDTETVLAFGRDLTHLTVEIEDVATEALDELKKLGKIVFPDPEHLRLIQDKGKQKQFYQKNNISSPDFQLWENAEELIQSIEVGSVTFPFVQKTRKAGYDGRGVQIIRCREDLRNLFQAQSLTEDLVSLQKELAVIVSRNSKGEMAVYDPVEMIFDPEANLVDNLLAPAAISESEAKEANRIALEVMEKLGLTGLLAVEMFLDQNRKIWVNEVAPRPHNSGHHTIEHCLTSQYEQHLRAILGLAPGSTQSNGAAVMVNLLGSPGFEGPADYQGLEDVLGIPGVSVHLYGKPITKPKRKMGHATILDQSPEAALQKAQRVKTKLKIISK